LGTYFTRATGIARLEDAGAVASLVWQAVARHTYRVLFSRIAHPIAPHNADRPRRHAGTTYASAADSDAGPLGA